MNRGTMINLMISALVAVAIAAIATVPVSAQAPREDVIWARVASGPITLDGVLDEPDWALAESKSIYFRTDNGIPGSGYTFEGGHVPADSTRATLKFLAYGNQLYMAAVVPDQSIGGSTTFNRFDGLLMGLKDHTTSIESSKPVSEYFYSWWMPVGTDTLPQYADPQPPGQLPHFMGRWAELPWALTPRTAEQIDAWDAATVVNGLTNSDTTLDTGYTIEMRFNLTPMGYDITQPQGDIVEWNIDFYDCDWFWPIDNAKFSSNRVWWQGPWGNQTYYNEVRIYGRPDVTVNSGPVPHLGPEITIPETGDSAPVIDGSLSDAVWSSGTPYTFEITYGDTLLRKSYSGIGPHRAGQFEINLYGGANPAPPVLDPADATVQVVTKGDYLYMAFDVRDQVVQYATDVNRWDGFIVSINDREQRVTLDHALNGQRLSFQVGPDGTAMPQDYLLHLVNVDSASVAITLGAGTTVDTLGQQADNGYTAELAIDLKALGYPAGLGDGALFLGVDLLDGDSFTPYTDSYGTRTWWYREYENECCPVWAHMAGAAVTGVGPVEQYNPGFILGGSYPNPARAQRIQYTLPEPSRVTLEVFDLKGGLVATTQLGLQSIGDHTVPFDGSGLGRGIYYYRLTMKQADRDVVRARMTGHMVILN